MCLPYQREEYVNLGDVCRNRIGMQCQYGSRYSQTICADLRFRGTVADYHSMEIHWGDVEEYVERVLRHRREIGAI